MRIALALVIAVAACDDQLLPPPSPPNVEVVEVASFAAVPSRDLDLLFQLDDSVATAHFQHSLAVALPTLFEALAIDGRLPNLHIGVTTSDLGTSGSDDPANPGPPVGGVGSGGCAGQGDDGALLVAGGAPVTGHFVIDEDDGAGGRGRNYTGALDEVVGQMVRVGSTGCGFEQPLSATRRALVNPENAGFLRPDASLAIVILADEDDCSIRDAGLLAQGDDGPLGPLQSFRCTKEGVSCDEPIDEVGPKTNCRPRADSSYVEDIAVSTAFFASLKPHRHQLTVAAIVGPETPFAVEERNFGMQGDQHALAHSCVWEGMSGPNVADPAVRLTAFAESFGSRGDLSSICHTDLAPHIARIGGLIKQSLGVACLDTSKLADSRPAPFVQPSCEVEDVLADGSRIAIPACTDDGDCYRLRADEAACPETTDHLRLVIERKQPPAADTHVVVRCEIPSA